MVNTMRGHAIRAVPRDLAPGPPPDGVELTDEAVLALAAPDGARAAAAAEDALARERALVARAQGGDNGAFDELVIAYQDRIFNLVTRMVGDHDEACDLVQEAFVKAFRALSSFRLDARFSTWLYRIAINGCYSRHRRRAVRTRHAPVSLDAPAKGKDEEASREPADHRHGPAQSIARTETIALVQAAIGELDPEFRTVVLLRELEGYSYEDISAILGCPIGTVRSRLHRARAELAIRLKRVVQAG